MNHQLFDTRLDAHFGPVRFMSGDAALLANQALYLEGKTWLGWKPLELELAVPAAPRPRAEGPPAGLVDALVTLGYQQREAKRLAATIEGGTVEEGIRQIHERRHN